MLRTDIYNAYKCDIVSGDQHKLEENSKGWFYCKD